MNDESTKNGLNDIAKELSEGQLSRRGLFDRLKGLGVGIGAAYFLGLTAARAAKTPEAAVTLKSTNPALDAIIQEGAPAAAGEADTKQLQMAYDYYDRYHRYSRYYDRHYYSRY